MYNITSVITRVFCLFLSAKEAVRSVVSLLLFASASGASFARRIASAYCASINSSSRGRLSRATRIGFCEIWPPDTALLRCSLYKGLGVARHLVHWHALHIMQAVALPLPRIVDLLQSCLSQIRFCNTFF
ncbi:hypothetical protein HAX54_036185 [Datura stramonium]|uniref:Secreted protein n=1 Tax=Datura stramonium TaxID=4076 RepID=A0ABS8SG25_DATST|nr:hypothetical protein [Datura stramonium]